MSKSLLIARHQFRREVTKRSFLIILFMMPLFMAFVVGFGFLFSRLEQKNTILGYVDEADLISAPLASSEKDDVSLVPFETNESAQAALDAGQIDGYYFLPADYADGRKADLIYYEAPSYRAMAYFEDQVRLNLLAGQSPALAERAMFGADVTVKATDSNREFAGGGPSIGQFLPLIAAAMFAFLVLTTSGYMLTVVVEEKENRTMEIIVTSVSTFQMMVGKVIGAIGIAFLQFVVWVTFIAGGIWIGANVLDISWLQDLEINWPALASMVIVALPAYLFIAALATLLGATLVDDQEAQQVGPFLFLILLAPIYLILPIASNPNGPLALGLSFFPMTSVMTMAMRQIFIAIPAWQIAISAIVALVCAITTVILAGKAFRMNMLRYGQRMKLRDLFGGRSTKPEAIPSDNPVVAGGGQS